MQSKKFTLIIPFFNSFDYLKKCLHSVYRSPIKPNEIIVVDDFSEKTQTTKCRAFLKSLNKKNLRYIRIKKNLGPGGARNLGVKKSSFNLIFFIDADTVVLKNTFERFLKNIKKYDAVAGIYTLTPATNTHTSHCKTSLYYFLYRKNSILTYDHFPASCAGIKKKVFLNVGGFDPFFKKGIDLECEEFGFRISEKYKLIIDTGMQVKHHFPSFLKMHILLIKRSMLWMEMFLVRRRFSPTAVNSSTGAKVIFSPMLVSSIFVFLLLKIKFFLLFSIFFLSVHLLSFKDFFAHHFKRGVNYFFIMLFFSIMFNTAIFCGCCLGLLKSFFNLSKIKKEFS